MVLLLFLLCLPVMASEHKVVLEGMKFIPFSITIKRGDGVSWENKDLVPHTATSKTNKFDSKSIPPGKSWRKVFNNKGIYSYRCKMHPLMRAHVVVE